MRIYEGMFLLDDSRATENWDSVVRMVCGLLEKRGAEIFTCERWDERKLAYPIKRRNRAVYLLTRFTAPADALGPIKRDAALNDTILRVLLIRDYPSEKLHKAGLFPPKPEGEPAEEAEGQPAPSNEPDAPAPGQGAQEPSQERKPTAEEGAPAPQEPPAQGE